MASGYCNVNTVTVEVFAGDGANGYNGTGVVTATGSFNDSPDTSFDLLAPGGQVTGGVTYPSSDAGKTEVVTVSVTWSDSETPVVSTHDVTLPDACPTGTTTTTVPTPPPPSTTVTVPPLYPPAPLAPCNFSVPGGSFSGPAADCTSPPAPSSQVAGPAAPAVAHAAVVPVGAPQTGFGGAASSSFNWLLPTGGGLVLIGLLTALILFTTRKRDA